MISIDLLCDLSVLYPAADPPGPALSKPPGPVGGVPDISIYFYADVGDPDNVVVFGSYLSFMEFCDSKGYVVPDSLEWRLCYLDELHCSAEDLSGLGIKSIVGDRTYDGLCELMMY